MVCSLNRRGKLTANDNKNVESFYNLVRTDKVYKLFKDMFLESQTAVVPCVWIRDERIILQWHLLVVRCDLKVQEPHFSFYLVSTNSANLQI